MINVLIPQDKEFNKYRNECKKLYESVQDKICDPNSFEFVVKNTFFYLFVEVNDIYPPDKKGLKITGRRKEKNNTPLSPLISGENRLIGGIYYFINEDGDWFLNGFANRKMHSLCVECLKMSLDWFKGSIYAEAQNRASALCLLRCGFKRVKGKLFKMEN